MGVGKTATCRELQKILPRNVFLDGDWCWDMHPFVVTEETKAMVNSNIVHLLNGFLACSEFENVIFCWVLHEQHILDDLINALNPNGCTTHCFSLVSTEQALVERLNRDIAAGKRGSDITERSVARISLYDELDTVKIDVSTISPADAARRITEHMAPFFLRILPFLSRAPDRMAMCSAEKVQPAGKLFQRRCQVLLPLPGVTPGEFLASADQRDVVPRRDENDPAVAGQGAVGFVGAEKRARRAR